MDFARAYGALGWALSKVIKRKAGGEGFKKVEQVWRILHAASPARTFRRSIQCSMREWSHQAKASTLPERLALESLDCSPLRGREGLPLERFVKKREEAPSPRAEAAEASESLIGSRRSFWRCSEFERGTMIISSLPLRTEVADLR